MILVNRQYIVN